MFLAMLFGTALAFAQLSEVRDGQSIGVRLHLGQRVVLNEPAPACAQVALALLREREPVGYHVYERLRDTGQESAFLHFLNCNDPIYLGLHHAVHEGLHILATSTSSAPGSETPQIYRLYPYEGGTLEFPVINTFPRGEIQAYRDAAESLLDPVDHIYFAGTRSSEPFLTLLDELNSYIHDVRMVSAFSSRIPEGTITPARDVVAIFMRYLALYLRVAAEQHPEVHANLAQDPRTVATINAIWESAKAALQASCHTRRAGSRDSEILSRYVFTAENLQSLVPFIPNVMQDLASPIARGCPAPAATEPATSSAAFTAEIEFYLSSVAYRFTESERAQIREALLACTPQYNTDGTIILRAIAIGRRFTITIQGAPLR